MAIATARCTDSTGKQKGRPGKSGLSINFINYGTNEYNLAAQQAQHLCDRFGLSPAFATVVGPLYFGEAGNA